MVGGVMSRHTRLTWSAMFYMLIVGVPGMVAAMVRHLKSLRTLQRDHGWIHTLLGKPPFSLGCSCPVNPFWPIAEEAENERMHLLTALTLKKPGTLFRLSVIGAQGKLGLFSEVFMVE